MIYGKMYINKLYLHFGWLDHFVITRCTFSQIYKCYSKRLVHYKIKFVYSFSEFWREQKMCSPKPIIFFRALF